MRAVVTRQDVLACLSTEKPASIDRVLALLAERHGREVKRPAVWAHLSRALEDRLVVKVKGGVKSFWTLTEAGEEEMRNAT